jgi:hypothetical protein
MYFNTSKDILVVVLHRVYNLSILRRYIVVVFSIVDIFSQIIHKIQDKNRQHVSAD